MALSDRAILHYLGVNDLLSLLYTVAFHLADRIDRATYHLPVSASTTSTLFPLTTKIEDL